MVKISELSNWAWIWWTEQVPVNDSWTTVKYTVDQILARTHNHTASQVTDFNTAVDARVDVPNDTAKTTPVDTDVFALWDTIRKKVTRANIKATLKTYFDTLYHTKNALRTGLTASQILTTDWGGNEWYTALSLLPVVASDAEALAWTNETKFINPKQLSDVALAKWQTQKATASATLKYSANTERSSATTTYIKVKEININVKWTIRVSFDLKQSWSSWFWRVYINWSAVWIERNTTSTTYVNYSEDFTVNIWDLVQLYYKTWGSWTVFIQNFRMSYDKTYLADWVVITN